MPSSVAYRTSVLYASLDRVDCDMFEREERGSVDIVGGLPVIYASHRNVFDATQLIKTLYIPLSSRSWKKLAALRGLLLNSAISVAVQTIPRELNLL